MVHPSRHIPGFLARAAEEAAAKPKKAPAPRPKPPKAKAARALVDQLREDRA